MTTAGVLPVGASGIVAGASPMDPTDMVPHLGEDYFSVAEEKKSNTQDEQQRFNAAYIASAAENLANMANETGLSPQIAYYLLQARDACWQRLYQPIEEQAAPSFPTFPTL
jgi:hypothetical protein